MQRVSTTCPSDQQAEAPRGQRMENDKNPEPENRPPAWLEQAIAAEGESRFLEVDDCPIHYLRWGDPQAPGILFLAGSGGHAHWFSHVAPIFADRFHVASMDFSGCGDSGRRDAYSQALMTREIMAVCADAGMLRAGGPILVGHSAGAQAVVRAALAHGEDLLGVIAVDGIRYAELEKDPAIKILSGPRPAPRPPRIYATRDDAEASFRLAPAPLRPIEERHVIDHIARHSFRPVDGGWSSKFDTRHSATTTLGLELKDRLKELKCQAAVLYGESTHLADLDAAAAIAAATGGRVPVLTLPGTTHYPMIDSPLAFTAAIKAIGLVWLAGWPIGWAAAQAHSPN